jgi:hypothetical protein
MASTKNTNEDGEYDAAIVAIAIGNDPDMAMEDDSSETDILAVLGDGGDIDLEETWTRQCSGEVPSRMDDMETQQRFGNLPTGVQMKLVLELRELEKSTLLQNLRECNGIVERLKHQLFESEDKRLELEHELDAENRLVQEMKREFEEIKESNRARLKDIDRIIWEMMLQRERLSRMIETQQSPPPPLTSSGRVSPRNEEDNSSKQQQGRAISSDRSSEERVTGKNTMEIEFDRKLASNPRFRAEFEQFQEFQEYYRTIMLRDANVANQNLTEEYKKLLEFQLGYERILASTTTTTQRSYHTDLEHH